MKNILKKIIPSFIKRSYRKIFPAPKTFGWFGDYKSWEEAKVRCTGYDSANILDKVKASVLKVKNGEAKYERDSVLFDEIQYSEELVSAFRMIAEDFGSKLHVVDFGGSLGSSYFQNRSFLQDLKELNWSVVEQEHFVEAGKKEIAGGQLQFYYTIEEALKIHPPQVLFVSSVFQYFEKPYELIQSFLNMGFKYIVVDRTAFIEGTKERITVQIVPDFVYKASYPAWFFNEQRFVSAFSSEYSLIRQFDSKFDPVEKLDGMLCYRKGFVFKRK